MLFWTPPPWRAKNATIRSPFCTRSPPSRASSITKSSQDDRGRTSRPLGTTRIRLEHQSAELDLPASHSNAQAATGPIRESLEPGSSTLDISPAEDR